MTALRLALLTLGRKPLSTGIAVLAIALAVGSSGVLLRLYLLSQSRFARMAPGPEVLIGAKSGGIEMVLSALNAEGPLPGYLPLALFESLRSQQTVRFSDGTSAAPGFVKSVTPFLAFARSDKARVIATDSSFFRGLAVNPGSFSEDEDTVVAGERFARRSNLHPGDHVRAVVWTEPEAPTNPEIDLKVVGILKATDTVWDDSLFSNLATAQKALARADLSKKSIWGDKVLSFFFVDLNPGGAAALETLINQRTVGQAVFVEKEKTRLQDLVGTGQDLGLALTFLILILGGLCVGAMLISRYDGMSVQIALLRALGYEKKFISSWLLLEGFLIGVSASLIGAGLDGVFFPILRLIFGETLPNTDIPLWQSAPVWIVALLTTSLAVVFPLWRLQRQSLHQSLRG